jgi:hypothetical protein
VGTTSRAARRHPAKCQARPGRWLVLPLPDQRWPADSTPQWRLPAAFGHLRRAAASGFRPASMSSAGRSTGGWATPGTPRNPICTFMPRTTRSSTPTTAAAIDHLSAALRRRPGTARRSNVGTGQLADVRAVIISRRPVETGRELTSARTSAKVLTNDGLRSLRTASCQYFPTQSSLFITQLISGWSYTSMRRTINECG